MSSATPQEKEQLHTLAYISIVITFILWMIALFPYKGLWGFILSALVSSLMSIFTCWVVMIALIVLAIPFKAAAQIVRDIRKSK